MSWYEALILGIVQGLTEFLPVSSSGHLEIFSQAILHTSGEENLTFAIIVHAATVLSTLVILWAEVARLFKGTFTTMQWNSEKDYVAKILVSMIPVFIVGMFFKDQVEAFFGNGLLLVGICLLITAGLLTLSEWLQKKRQGAGHEVTYKDAIIIGIAQACAVLPGLSRSGTTIATGLLCGEERECGAVLVPDGADSYHGRGVPGLAEDRERRRNCYYWLAAGCRRLHRSFCNRLFRVPFHD